MNPLRSAVVKVSVHGGGGGGGGGLEALASYKPEPTGKAMWEYETSSDKLCVLSCVEQRGEPSVLPRDIQSQNTHHYPF